MKDLKMSLSRKNYQQIKKEINMINEAEETRANSLNYHPGRLVEKKSFFNVEKIILREGRSGNTSDSIIDGIRKHTIPVEESFEEIGRVDRCIA